MLNFQNAFQMIQQMQNNPQMILQRFGIPDHLKSPDEVAQYLMQSGKVTQQQIDQAKQFFKR